MKGDCCFHRWWPSWSTEQGFNSNYKYDLLQPDLKCLWGFRKIPLSPNYQSVKSIKHTQHRTKNIVGLTLKVTERNVCSTSVIFFLAISGAFFLLRKCFTANKHTDDSKKKKHPSSQSLKKTPHIDQSVANIVRRIHFKLCSVESTWKFQSAS